MLAGENHKTALIKFMNDAVLTVMQACSCKTLDDLMQLPKGLSCCQSRFRMLSACKTLMGGCSDIL